MDECSMYLYIYSCFCQNEGSKFDSWQYDLDKLQSDVLVMMQMKPMNGMYCNGMKLCFFKAWGIADLSKSRKSKLRQAAEQVHFLESPPIHGEVRLFFDFRDQLLSNEYIFNFHGLPTF